MKILNIDTQKSHAGRRDPSIDSRAHSRSMSSDIIKKRPKNLSRSRSNSNERHQQKSPTLHNLSKSIQSFHNQEKNIDSF
jgi:hypothetical protein